MNENLDSIRSGLLRDAEARREVSALCEGVRAALEAVDGARLLDDDMPEMALEALARWSDGAASAEELDGVVHQLDGHARSMQEESSRTAPAVVALVHAVDSLARVARDVASADGRTVAVDRTALWWAETTLELLGEEAEAAVARIAMRWDAALRRREH
jgi:hypothetical protein